MRPKRPEHEPSSAAKTIDVLLDDLRVTLYEVAFRGESVSPELREELEGDLEEALRVAIAERLRRRARPDTVAHRITIAEVVARSLKHLREAAELTQEALAELMRRIGFVGWKRITVAEAEGGKRKLTIEEMMGVAVLFDVPVAYLLTGLYPDEAVVLNERHTLTPAQAQGLIADTPLDEAWAGVRLSPLAAGASFVGEDFDWRPAREGPLWSNVVQDEDGVPVIARGR